MAYYQQDKMMRATASMLHSPNSTKPMWGFDRDSDALAWDIHSANESA